MFVRIWQFRPDPKKIEEFLSGYGPDGEWAMLFGMGTGFRGTELLKSVSDPELFITIDRWSDAAAWESFKQMNTKEYEMLDARCEALTADEHEIGSYYSFDR